MLCRRRRRSKKWRHLWLLEKGCYVWTSNRRPATFTIASRTDTSSNECLISGLRDFFLSYGRALRHKSYSGGCFGRALVVVFVVDVFLHFISLLEVKDSRRSREDYFFFFYVWRLPAAGFREKALTFTRPLRPPSSSSYSNWKLFLFLFVSVCFLKKKKKRTHKQRDKSQRQAAKSHVIGIATAGRSI